MDFRDVLGGLVGLRRVRSQSSHICEANEGSGDQVYKVELGAGRVRGGGKEAADRVQGGGKENASYTEDGAAKQFGILVCLQAEKFAFEQEGEEKTAAHQRRSK